ncbi:MAG TPA: diguanylate cyclase [Vicinamibacteria bacterium]|nr:diguanylate cyclase [Vicinamibacteria bacterium]
MAKPSLHSFRGDRPDFSGWQFRSAFEKLGVATFFFDATNRLCLDANKEAERLTGYERKELLDLRLEELHPRHAKGRAVEHFQRFSNPEGFSYDDIALETKEQGSFPVAVRGVVLGFDDGKVVLVQCRDLSEERLLQREVLFQNHKLTALNSLSSAISKSLDLTEILEDSLVVIMEASGSLYGEMLLFQEENKSFQVAAFRGDRGIEPSEKALSFDECELAFNVLESGEPRLAESLKKEPRLAKLLEGVNDLGAVAGVPLRSKNRVLGVMQLAIGERQLFPTFDFDLFTSIGNQVGMAAENALLFQRTLRQSKEIKVLNNIARIISSSLQIEEVFDAFAHEMKKLVAFDRLSVAFLDPSGSYLRIFASGARADSGWGMESLLPLVGTGPGWVVLNERHFIHDDTKAHQRFIEDQFLYEDGIRSYILLPLESRRRIIGSFGLGSRRECAFSDKDLPLLSQLSKQISVAIDNVSLYQRTKENSILDDVSSLFNLRYFHQALERELKLVIRHKSRLSLLFIDLDNFKNINDTHGHLRGTKVLREVGFLLRAAIRETDIAARYGGDEFVVILPDTDAKQAKRLGERMRQLILRTTFLKEEGINSRLGASIGLATFPSEAPTKEELIHLADERMYRDKEENRAKPIPRET